jgi:hypothetical protein
LMLPPELIRARRRQGLIRLSYASEAELSLAKTLISVYVDHVGGKRGLLDDALSGCEELGYDYKLVRGFSWVLEGRCSFEAESPVDSRTARREVFREAGRRVVASEEERNRVLSAAAFRLGVSVEELNRSIFADLEDEHLLRSFDPLEPMVLILEYNFSLTLGLLAHARRLEVTYRGPPEELGRLASRIGRSSSKASGGLTTTVAEWRATSRMGYKSAHIEALLARLLSMGFWSLSSEVVYPLKSRRAYRLELGSDLEGRLIKPPEVKPTALVERPKVVSAPPRPRGDVVVVADVARRMGLTEDEVREMYGEDFLDLGGVLLTEGKRDEILGALEGSGDMTFGGVRRLLKELGVKDPLAVLEAFGYLIEWERDRDESRVYRL